EERRRLAEVARRIRDDGGRRRPLRKRGVARERGTRHGAGGLHKTAARNELSIHEGILSQDSSNRRTIGPRTIAPRTFARTSNLAPRTSHAPSHPAPSHLRTPSEYDPRQLYLEVWNECAVIDAQDGCRRCDLDRCARRDGYRPAGGPGRLGGRRR